MERISGTNATGYLKGGDLNRLTVSGGSNCRTVQLPGSPPHVQPPRDNSFGNLHVFEKPRFRPKGLTNVGNTCYANAVLQCLLSTALTQALMDPTAAPVFREYSFNRNILNRGSGSVDSEDSDEQDNDEDEVLPKKENSDAEKREREMLDRCLWLTHEVKKLTLSYVSVPSKLDMEPTMSESISSLFFKAESPVVNPQSITRHPHRISRYLRPYQQEDAHEFLRSMLSTLSMNGRNKELSSLFDGLLESSITCQSCGNETLTRDRYMDLSLDIADKDIQTLHDALKHFTQWETLDGNNSVHCTRCRVKCAARKSLRMATAPSIMVCHLKRFSFSSSGLVRLGKKVKFPTHLEIGDYMSNLNQSKPPEYELVAVLVHQGQSCEAGHYVAFVKSEGEWFCCNDKEVSQVPVEKVMRQQAYILMYEVANMRESHGFPSPSGVPKSVEGSDECSLRSAPSSKSLMNSMLCGLDDDVVRSMCCVLSPAYGTPCVGHTAECYVRDGMIVPKEHSDEDDGISKDSGDGRQDEAELLDTSEDDIEVECKEWIRSLPRSKSSNNIGEMTSQRRRLTTSSIRIHSRTSGDVGSDPGVSLLRRSRFKAMRGSQHPPPGLPPRHYRTRTSS
mmetsp:Transcript_19326/g.41590  ORF Transcript_19326/g.41590 Transcript_19326/m.41590 type:complete len:619 (+) Transcript_19326:352-2208(+)